MTPLRVILSQPQVTTGLTNHSKSHFWDQACVIFMSLAQEVINKCQIGGWIALANISTISPVGKNPFKKEVRFV